jgi:7,8-dihydropterin-6-yl-methyl-4-(beta-D-ribofuranosyl)aminobenzene 5'-phosphate synthase
VSIRIVTLSENTAGMPGVLAEWGLSILVETKGLNILVDTGASSTVPHNVRPLGVDLSSIQKVVLSHGHFDHTGGLKGVLLQSGRKIEVIAHPDVFGNKYTRIGQTERYIGMPYNRKELESAGASFKLSKEPVWITDNIVTTGEIPMVTEYEAIEPHFVLKTDTGNVPDTFTDDQALIIKTEMGLILILGCAHRGMINTLRHAQKITGVQEINTVIGGTHLLQASEERTLMTAATLQEMGVQRIGVSHCTGMKASVLLAQQLGDVFFSNNTGSTITIE